MGADGFSRRGFLGVVTAGTVVACSDRPGEGGGRVNGADGDEPVTPGEFRESPMLAEQVNAGSLQPVAERLPKEPYVVRPGMLVADDDVHAGLGKFGGTLQLAQEAPTGDPIIFVAMVEPLLWAPNGFDFAEGIHPNVLSGWETSDDTVFTFHLREGLRWSDGEPVTIEDVRFAFEDVLYNEQITAVLPAYLRAGRRSDAAPAKLEVIDDLTFSLRFDQPYGTFPSQLAIAGWISYADIIKPRHHLEQFHRKYADPTELAELLDAESIAEDEWFNLFNARQLTGWLWNATTEDGLGHPTLTPWVLRQAESGVFTYERNPYYFKVDTDGNQLPYIDAIRSQVVQDKETLTSRALFGEFDYLGERATFRTMPLMAEEAEKGNIKLFVPRQHVLPTTVFLNLTHEDQVWRTVVRDVRFRRALSLAINRSEIIDDFYLGEFASLPTKTNPGDHDPAEANRLLDEMGLNETDSEGFRLGPDGNRFRVPFEIVDQSENHIPIGELIAEYWNNVGVFTTVRQIDATLSGERRVANELKADILWSVYPMWPSAGWFDYLPENNFGPLWNEWYTTRGESGEEPPSEIKDLYTLHGTFVAGKLGSSESDAALDAIVKSHYDNLWELNLVEDAYWPTFFTTRVKNVPDGIKKDVFGIIVTYSMEQWYLDG